MSRKVFAFAIAMVCIASFAEESLVWRDSHAFKSIKKDLSELRSRYAGNSDLDRLWEESARIAAMNDQCSVISLEDALNEECGHFYKVELPEFEAAFQKVSGELRIASIEIQSDMRKQTNILKACAEALDVFYVSESQLEKFSGDDVKMKAVNFEGTDYTAVFNFKITPNAEILGSLANLMQTWEKKCRDAVAENIELFAQGVDIQNNVMAQRGSPAEARVVLGVDRKPYLQFFHRMNAGGHYELGNKSFCDTRNVNIFKEIEMGGMHLDKDYDKTIPYLSLSIRWGNVSVASGGASCNGEINLKANENFWGRWVWNDDGVNCSAVFKRGSKDYWRCMEKKNQ